jgi:hypothetical protein
MKRPTPEQWQLLANIATAVSGFLGTIVAGIALTFAWLAWSDSQDSAKNTLAALQESQKSNTTAAVQELYAQERWWFDKCLENPLAYTLFCSAPNSIPDDGYIDTYIKTIGGESVTVNDVHELYWHVWNIDGFSTAEDSPQQRFRRVFDIAESVLYCMDTSFTFKHEGVFSEQEFSTWGGLLGDVGPHPLLLLAIEIGHEQQYFSREFGKWLVGELNRHPRAKAAQKFYPEMFSDTDRWLSELVPVSNERNVQPAMHARPRPQPH